MTARLTAPLVLAAMLGAGGCRPASTAAQTAAGPQVTAASDVEAGRYLTLIGGCNDCHTPGWAETGGRVPEARRLTGSSVGWRGPWGTTYPANLRRVAAAMTEDDFVAVLRTRKDRPPMPWMNVNQLHPRDARAIYRYLRALGPAGQAVPAGLAPGEAASTPVIDLVPRPPAA